MQLDQMKWLLLYNIKILWCYVLCKVCTNNRTAATLSAPAIMFIPTTGKLHKTSAACATLIDVTDVMMCTSFLPKETNVRLSNELMAAIQLSVYITCLYS